MRDASEFHDTIVVGAGCAGLACAQRLVAAGRDVLVLEARARIGGRVFSVEESGYPLELGAEFVHGAPPSSLKLLADARVPFYDVQDRHLVRSKGRLHEADYFSAVERITAKLNRRGKRDRTVEEFLNSQKLRPELRDMFRSYVEGFHAADLRLIGEKELAAAQDGGGSEMFRTAAPYMKLLEYLRAKIAAIEMQTRLRGIRWRRGKVELSCVQGGNEIRYRARRVVLTLPVGVLKTEGLSWDPLPEELTRYLAAVEMGHVQRLVCEFKSRFWEGLSNEPVVFLHAGPEQEFPTFWSARPMHTPMLTAWQGGPKALVLAGLPLETRVEKALRTLTRITGKRGLEKELVGVHTHNWTLDPNARGAYSFVRAGGLSAAAGLNKPLENTLYFAGEGHAPEGERGTVHGALNSGLAAAERILQV